LQNDHWLRKRNGCWELKYPIKFKSMKTDGNESNTQESLHKGSKTDMYHETSDEKNILSRIEAISPIEMDISSEATFDLDHLVLSGRLWPFAEIDTNRKEYQLVSNLNSSGNKEEVDCQHTVTVVIDATSWGFLIGEVEILVRNEEDIENAINQIEMIAKKLEFTMNEERGGKVLNYLKQHRPCAYSTYMETFKSS